ncbi:plasmid segregation protein ParM domain-containing protein [Pantoea vagans]|uniref:plasmid segregation protein ParM domain-containing protein n=1 Tax=Pantoea vagans TaxID=470934 RepID=UPI0028A72844|nr:plasmid segregation protein ParM domain-containing protein [Pantoea vagans]
MKMFIDDGSTNVKLAWHDKDCVKTHLSPNSFKREWSVAFGDKPVFNYTMNGEQYSYDPIAPEAVKTTNIAWQYSDVNVVAVHHALLQTGLIPCEVDITVTLPLTEFYDHNNQPAAASIEKKKASLLRPVSLNGGESFKIRSVSVMPESIPAGFELLSELDLLDSLLIVDLGGTTLDISQVRGRMSGITRIHGDATIGVSLVTTAVADALRVAGTRGSSYLADDIIVHRNDDAYLERRINDLSRVSLVKSTITESLERLTQRVLSAMAAFEGYTHVMVIGGGAEIIAEAVRTHCGVRAERFYKTDSSQFDLVRGMIAIG